MKRVDLYTQILKALDVEVGEDGRLFMSYDESREPIYHDGKPFYLPTKEVLGKSALETDGYLFFDPLTESALRQESDSVKLLRRLMIARLQLSSSIIMSKLIKTLRDVNSAKQAKGNQTLLYRQNINVTSTTYRSYNNVLKKGIKDSVTNRILNIFLKRGGILDGERYARIAVVSFPILDALDDKLNSIFGVEMSAKDKEAILKLFCFIFFGSNEVSDDEFSAGSNVKMAPYFQALCFAFCNVARRLNSFNRTYNSLYNQDGSSKAVDRIHIDLAFEEYIQELNIYKKDPMPILAGNTGGLTAKAKEEEASEKLEDEEEVILKPEFSSAKPKVATRLEVNTPTVQSSTPAPQVAVVERKPMAGKSFTNQVEQQAPTTGRTTIPVVGNVSRVQHQVPQQSVVRKVVVVEPQQQQVPVEEVVYVDVYGNRLDPSTIPPHQLQQQAPATYYPPARQQPLVRHPPAYPNAPYANNAPGYSNGNQYGGYNNGGYVNTGYGNGGYGNAGYGGYSAGVNRYTGKPKRY